jgi:membrane associated rhomboid family serine protease
MTSFLRRPLPYRFYNATVIIIVACILVFLYGFVDRRGRALLYLSLIPDYVLQAGAWWQVVTYMFVHGGWGHIFFNMLALFLFGIQLERRMGSTEFALFYFVSGVGAGIATVFINSATGQGMIPVVGASGAIFGVLLAFASYFPDARIFIFGILPMRAPVAVGLYAGIEIVASFTSFQSGVAHLTHLAGLAFGWLYLVARLGINPITIFFRRR